MNIEKSQAELDREKIVVENSNDQSEGDNQEGEKENGKQSEGDKQDNEGESDDENTTIDDNEAGKKDDESEEGDDESEDEDEKVDEEETEGEKSPEVLKLEKQIARMEKRIAKETGNKKDLQRELAAAQAALEAKNNEENAKYTPEELDQLADKLANDKVAQREFNAACNRIGESAVKADKDFDKKMKDLIAEKGENFIPPQMIAMLDELDHKNGGEVLAHLFDDPDKLDEVLDIKGLTRLASRLDKISNELVKAKETPLKKVSKVPPPPKVVKPNGRNSSTVDLADPNLPMERYVEERNKQEAEKLARRFGRTTH